MKVIFIAMAVACLVLVAASPAKDLKEIKKEQAKKKACAQACEEKYLPLCAGKPGQKPISFGNACVLNNYNCEKNENLAKVSDGECPGGGGVRLS